MGCIQKVNNYFNEKYPELLLCEITPLQIQQFYNDMYNSGLTGLSRQLGLLVDETLDTKLENQKEWFCENSGLTVTS